ncbi:MAG: hypothetical protein R3Y64_05015 [Peptostreptococcaceae bacterium]
MSSYIKIIYDKLDFLQFKQNILFHKLPQHKVDIFLNMTIDEFITIRDFTLEFEENTSSDNFNLNFYENEVKRLWPTSKSFPLSSYLIAKSLLNQNTYNKLIT